MSTSPPTAESFGVSAQIGFGVVGGSFQAVPERVPGVRAVADTMGFCSLNLAVT